MTIWLHTWLRSLLACSKSIPNM